ncbi:MAG: metal-dependent hydrolase, partial [Sediminibacterium sp.]|nr:metal-dependent hydrolase [Sediminibacterium sp.]
GYRSLFDHSDTISFQYFPRNDVLLQPIAPNEDVARLVRFSQQFYTVEKYKDTLVFNDLRFGQETGWYDPHGKFAFHYYLQHSDDNALVVQRGRFAGWNGITTRAFIKRIKGN